MLIVAAETTRNPLTRYTSGDRSDGFRRQYRFVADMALIAAGIGADQTLLFTWLGQWNLCNYGVDN